jgi:hypothetical protein
VSPRAKHELAREHLDRETRKVATYDGDEPDLEGESLEDIATDVQTAVELAEEEAAT